MKAQLASSCQDLLLSTTLNPLKALLCASIKIGMVSHADLETTSEFRGFFYLVALGSDSHETSIPNSSDIQPIGLTPSASLS